MMDGDLAQGQFGRAIRDQIRGLGRAGILLLRAVCCVATPPYRLHSVLEQIQFIGSRSMSVILVCGLFVGMVLSLQFHDTLVRFGSVSLLGSAVGLSLLRELGPVLTALVVTGRAGSAICAELGMMRHDNQIDALLCMAIDPVRYLLAPRILAAVIAIPLLVTLFIVVGIFGGYLVGVVLFDLNPGTYFQGMSESILPRDQFMGLVKAVVFAILIIWISAAKGYYLHLNPHGSEGAAGVSRITTDAVVLCSISILFADYLISALLL